MDINKETYTFLPDTNAENKDAAYLDIDRMINEGMAGGNVYSAGNHQNIEETHDMDNETPPNVNTF